MKNRLETFSTPGHARLHVRNAAGDVEVATADVDETTVELVPLNDTDATRDAIEKASVAARGGEVVVEIEGRSWSISIGSWGFGSPKVGVRIECPHGSVLECDTASADVTCSGTLGSARLRSAAGDLSVEAVDGELVAKTVSGDIRVGRVGGVSSLHSVSGDVEVAEAAGDLNVQSVSGDQRVRSAGPGELAFKAVSGDIAVAIRRGLRVRLDVNSVSGSIGSELDVSDTPSASGAPETSLRARTVSGDVKIERAGGDQSSVIASASSAQA